MSLAPIGRMRTIHWNISSEIDPRWDGSGKVTGLISVRPHEVNNHVKKCEKRYGKRPKDLMYGAFKE